MPKITPCLWFDDQAEEAARFYTSVFKNSRIRTITYYGDGMPGPKGKVLTVDFSLDGSEFTALNGGPEFQFSEAVSFVVPCANQAEVDSYWAIFTADGGEESMCGWLKDKFGVSWQIVPTALNDMLKDPDTERVRRVTDVMLKMHKLDLSALERAYRK